MSAASFLYHHFGLRMAWWSVLTRATRRLHLSYLHRRALGRKDRAVLRCLRPVTAEALPLVSANEAVATTPSRHVWTMWWQGEDHMPPGIRACIESQRRYADGRHVVITAENYRQYVQLPGCVEHLLAVGRLSVTHFSDVLRCHLLAQKGGLWLDATILLTAPFAVPDANRWWTWREDLPHIACISKGRWTIGVTYMPQGHLLARYLCHAYRLYYSRHTRPIDYFLFDYLIAQALQDLPVCRAEWEAIAPRRHLFDAAASLGRPYSEEVWRAFCEASPLHYLSWKRPFAGLTPSGCPTLYHHIVHPFQA